MVENRMLVDSEWESVEDQYTDEEEDVMECEDCYVKIKGIYFVVNDECLCEDCMISRYGREVK